MKPEERDLWEALGRWTVTIARGGVHAELAPPQYVLDAVAALTAQSPAGVPPEPMCAAHSRIADRHAQCTCPVAPKCPFCGEQETRSVSVTERIAGTPVVATMPVRECNKCGQQWEDATTFSAKEAAVRAAGVPTTEPVAPIAQEPVVLNVKPQNPDWLCPHCNPCVHRVDMACRSPGATPWADDGVKGWPNAAPQAPVEPVAQEPVARCDQAGPGRAVCSQCMAGYYERCLYTSPISLPVEVPAMRQENADLWEYVWAMEAANIAMDEGAPVDTKRINDAQEKLKQRHAGKRNED